MLRASQWELTVSSPSMVSREECDAETPMCERVASLRE